MLRQQNQKKQIRTNEELYNIESHFGLELQLSSPGLTMFNTRYGLFALAYGKNIKTHEPEDIYFLKK